MITDVASHVTRSFAMNVIAHAFGADLIAHLALLLFLGLRLV